MTTNGMPAPRPYRSAVRLDSTVVRAHVSAAGVPKTKGRITPWVAAGAASAPQIHVLADRRGRRLRLRVTGGSRRDRTQVLVEAWTDAPRPRLMADRAYDGAPFRAWRAQRGTPEGAHESPAPRPGTVPGAQRH